MTVEQIRSKYISFFEKRGHTAIAAAPLVLENDPTTLFTSSGMQPLVPFLMGESHPTGSVRLVDSQPSIRVQDIEEVGDNRHTTFFEMLGNWSLGDYFKKEQLPWIYEFLTSKEEGLGLSAEKLFVSVFEGNDEVPKDIESISLWKEILKSDMDAVSGESGLVDGVKIYMYPAKKNWWSRSGTPEQMPVGEIGGPDSEIFYDFGQELQLHEKSSFKNEPCHPNCDCGRFMEIGNSVFIQYKKDQSGKLVELPQKNVDFGGGLERLAAAANHDPDVFTVDIFKSVITSIEEKTNKQYSAHSHSMRVIADHMRASVFLIAGGVVPSNKAQGYVLRRLLRRAIVKAKQLGADLSQKDLFYSVIGTFFDSYKATYFEEKKVIEITEVVESEIEKFSKTLEKGLKEVEKIHEIDGKVAFDLYQTYGFPLELSIEIFQEKGQTIDEKQFREAFEEHQNKSRTASAGVFKGGLMDHSAETTRLHTATHLLHAALRKVLGEHVGQKGSNITHERLRFDFTHNEKVTPEQIAAIQTLINEQVDKDLPVSFTMMSLDEAKKAGALAFFTQKYEEQVKVYTVGDPSGEFFSKEVCGGPHVEHLAEVGHVTITKEEAAGAGIRRIYATVS
jgi:alanyl-tRNA synthetase